MNTKEAILTSVNTHQGIKAVELVLDVMRLSNPFLDGEEYHKELESLVKSGEIVELEYILPNMDYRAKSIYFPKGTEFRVNINDRNYTDSSDALAYAFKNTK